MKHTVTLEALKNYNPTLTICSSSDKTLIAKVNLVNNFIDYEVINRTVGKEKTLHYTTLELAVEDYNRI